MSGPRDIELLCVVMGEMVGTNDDDEVQTIRRPSPWLEADSLPMTWGRSAAAYSEWHGSGEWRVCMEVIEACHPRKETIFVYEDLTLDFGKHPFARVTLNLDGCRFEHEGEYRLVFHEVGTRRPIGGRSFWVVLDR